jgi:hypothetical protein
MVVTRFIDDRPYRPIHQLEQLETLRRWISGTYRLIAGLGCSPEWREPLVRAASNPDPDRRADALFETLGHTAKETLEVVHRAHPVIEWLSTPSGQQFVAAIRAFFYL